MAAPGLREAAESLSLRLQAANPRLGRTKGLHKAGATPASAAERSRAPATVARPKPWADRRHDFSQRAACDEPDQSKKVSVEAMLWTAELTVNRLIAAQDISKSPALSESQLVRNRYRDLCKVLADDEQVQHLETFLAQGLTCNLWYCWLALEFFRTDESLHRADEEAASSDEVARSLATRKKARLIAEIFCQEGSAMFVPTGRTIRSKIDHVLWSTPDHIDTGSRVFVAMQAKVMVELERSFLNLFLQSKAYISFSHRECTAVVQHCNLSEVLENEEARGHFLAFLSNFEVAGTTASAATFVRPSELLAFWLAVRSFKRETSRSRQRQRGEQLVRSFLDNIPNRSLASCLFGRSYQERVEDLKQELADFFANATVRTARSSGPTMLDDAQRAAYFELRDRYFTDFMRSVPYLKCLSVLSKVPVTDLWRAIRQLGKSFAGQVTSRPPPPGSPTQAFYHMRDGRTISNQRSISSSSTSTMGTSDGRQSETKFDSEASLRHSATGLLDSGTSLSREFEAQSGSSISVFSGLARKLRKSTSKIGLAPPPSSEEIRSDTKISATPRSWDLAYQHPWELSEVRSWAWARTIVDSSADVRKRILLGLEGVLRHPELRALFAQFMANTCLEVEGAELLLSIQFDVRAIETIRSEAASEHVAIELAQSIFSNYLAPFSQFHRFVPQSTTNECCDAFEKLINSRAALDAADWDTALALLKPVRNAALNVLLRKYWPMFQSISKLDQALPGLLTSCFERP